jgi:hypothetical protein
MGALCGHHQRYRFHQLLIALPRHHPSDPSDDGGIGRQFQPLPRPSAGVWWRDKPFAFHDAADDSDALFRDTRLMGFFGGNFGDGDDEGSKARQQAGHRCRHPPMQHRRQAKPSGNEQGGQCPATAVGVQQRRP